MKDKILFEILDGQINTLQEERKELAAFGYDPGDLREIDQLVCSKIEALEDLRTKLVSKGFFVDETPEYRDKENHYRD